MEIIQTSFDYYTSLRTNGNILYKCISQNYINMQNKRLFFITTDRVYYTYIQLENNNIVRPYKETHEKSITIPFTSFEIVEYLIRDNRVKFYVFNEYYQHFVTNHRNSIITVVDNDCNIYFSQVQHRNEMIFPPVSEHELMFYLYYMKSPISRMGYIGRVNVPYDSTIGDLLINISKKLNIDIWKYNITTLGFVDHTDNLFEMNLNKSARNISDVTNKILYRPTSEEISVYQKKDLTQYIKDYESY